MSVFASRNWKGLLVLSVFIPLTLLTGFKLTGVISSPASITETIQLEPVVCYRERPYEWSDLAGNYSVDIDYVGDDVALHVKFCPHEYDPDFFGDIALMMGTDAVNVSVSDGFVESVEVAYKEAFSLSKANIVMVKACENLTLLKVADALTNTELLEGNKACVKFVAVGQPPEVSIPKLWLYYYLNTAYDHTHQITLETTVTYFNGTVLKRLVRPIEFNFGPDHDNSLEDAETIEFGTRQDYVDCDPNGDPVDWFKIWLVEGQEINVSILPYKRPGQPWPEVEVFDPQLNSMAYLSFGTPGVPWTPEQSHFQTVLNTNCTGWWYIKITSLILHPSLYQLDISPLSG